MTHAYEVVESSRESMPVGQRFMTRKLDHDDDGIYYFKKIERDDRGRTTIVKDVKVRYLGQLKGIKDPEKLHAALCAL